MTIDVARQCGEQGCKGSLEPGKLAYLVILDQNPLKVESMKIKDVKVVNEQGKAGSAVTPCIARRYCGRPAVFRRACLRAAGRTTR